jgi:hypothetical protein
MRRCNDGYVNATQILKALGIEKKECQEILEKKFPECEKKQGGYAKYQGVWIPVDKGLELCISYGFEEKLQSLLTDDRCAGGPGSYFIRSRSLGKTVNF